MKQVLKVNIQKLSLQPDGSQCIMQTSFMHGPLQTPTANNKCTVPFVPVDADGDECEDAAADGEDGDEVPDLAVDGAEGPVARQHVHQVEGHVQRRHHRVRHREVHCKETRKRLCYYNRNNRE